MRDNTRYVVCTKWGHFSLDERSYQDYLAGKLWISWNPGEKKTVQEPDCRNISARAVRLRDDADGDNPYALFNAKFPESRCTPYTGRVRDTSVQEMPLSVRSMNCLMRSGADTLGKLRNLMNSDKGLKSVRNLGLKSELEIRNTFFNFCYQELTPNEKSVFWQEALDEKETSKASPED